MIRTVSFFGHDLNAVRSRLSVVLLASLVLSAPAAAQTTADGFVREAVAAHRGVAAESLALERDQLALGRFRRLYLPAVSVEAQWVEQRGGADIGALINPAFDALNRITGGNDFPTDVSFRFPLKQDARFRLAMPLFDGAIGAAVRQADASRSAQSARLVATERDVVAAVRTALLRHGTAAELVRVRQAGLAALDEQLRAAEQRAAAGVDAPDVVLRARAERSEGVQRLLEAERGRDATHRTVNRLARRPLDAPLPTISDSSFTLTLPATLAEARAAQVHRPELASAEAQVAQATAGRRAALAASLPAVQVALDYGWQGRSWRFTGDQDFTQLTVQARWTPFTFGRNTRRRAEAALDLRRAELAREEARDQLALEVEEAWDALRVAEAALVPARDRAAAATRTAELVRRRWDEGMATHLELVSARAAATAAEVEVIVTRFQAAEARVALVRATTAIPGSLP